MLKILIVVDVQNYNYIGSKLSDNEILIKRKEQNT